jgi:hypothetical protein
LALRKSIFCGGDGDDDGRGDGGDDFIGGGGLLRSSVGGVQGSGFVGGGDMPLTGGADDLEAWKMAKGDIE